jgi:hypothetical protein
LDLSRFAWVALDDAVAVFVQLVGAVVIIIVVA